MKIEFYVFLPLVVTIFNVCVVFFLLNNSNDVGVQAQHQQPADRRIVVGDIGVAALQQDRYTESLLTNTIDVTSSGSIENYYANRNDWNGSYFSSTLSKVIIVDDDDDTDNDEDQNDIGSNKNQAINDPNLKWMPQYPNFQAYVRADISSYYQEPVGSRTEIKPAYTGLAGKFINMSPEQISLWWVDTNTGQTYLNGDINPWGSGGTATFAGHTFIFTQYQQPNNILGTFHVKDGISVYYYDPYYTTGQKKSTYKHSLPAEIPDNNVRRLENLSATDRQVYDSHVFNLQFGDDYQGFTKGSPWLTMYPPNKLLHKIWPAEYFGQTHTIATTETHFHSFPQSRTTSARHRKLSLLEMKRPSSEMNEYRQQGVLNLTLKALSCTPKAFEIRNFLSDFEVEHILGIVNQTQLERSTTNGHISTTRTSRTTWLGRDTDPIMNAIFRRVADVVQLDEAMLRQRQPGEIPHVQQLHKINEDLQIVHYDKRQEYTAHHDFGYPKGILPKDRISRSMNLAMYLNDVEEGGQTSFPRWRNAETSKSIDVKPEKGKALLFYMVNPDGNLEDMSQHAALPVIRGEKYFANLWMSTFQ